MALGRNGYWSVGRQGRNVQLGVIIHKRARLKARLKRSGFKGSLRRKVILY